MAKSKLKNPLIIILVIAVLAIAAWFFFTSTVNKKAEEHLQQYLVENNLQDRVKWEELEASATGTANLKKVRFLSDDGELLLTAEEFNLKHFKQDENLLETEVEIKGFVDVQGMSFQDTLAELYGMADVPPSNYIDLNWKVKLDNTKQTSYVKSDVLLPNLFSVETEINADSPKEIRELSKLSSNAFSREEPNQEELMIFISTMGKVKIQGLNVGVVEKGGIEKLRYEMVGSDLDDEESEMSSEQFQKQFEQEIAEAQVMCVNEPQLAKVLANQELACSKVMGFLVGASDAVKVNMSVKKPLSLDEITMMSLMGVDADMLVEEYGLSVEVE